VIECNRRSGRYYRNSLDLIIHNKVNPISQVSDPERNPSGSVWILILWNQVTAVCLERFRLRSARYLIKFCPVAAHCISSSSSSSSFSFISFFLLNLPAAGIKKQKPKKNCWSDQAATAAAAAASNVNQFLLLDSFLDFIGFCLPVSVPFLSIVFLCFYLIWFWFFFWTRSMSWLFFFSPDRFMAILFQFMIVSQRAASFCHFLVVFWGVKGKDRAILVQFQHQFDWRRKPGERNQIVLPTPPLLPPKSSWLCRTLSTISVLNMNPLRLDANS